MGDQKINQTSDRRSIVVDPLSAPPPKVWRALNEAQVLASWLMPNDTQTPRVATTPPADLPDADLASSDWLDTTETFAEPGHAICTLRKAILPCTSSVTIRIAAVSPSVCDHWVCIAWCWLP